MKKIILKIPSLKSLIQGVTKFNLIQKLDMKGDHQINSREENQDHQFSNREETQGL